MAVNERNMRMDRAVFRSIVNVSAVLLILLSFAGCVTSTALSEPETIFEELPPAITFDSVIINEVGLRNDTLQDTQGGYPLWIELYNSSDEAVSLKDWHIEYTLRDFSESEESPVRVRVSRFPDLILGPKGYRLLFFSPENIPVAYPGVRIAGMDLDGVEVVELFDPTAQVVDRFTIPDEYFREVSRMTLDDPPIRERSAVRDPLLVSAIRTSSVPTPGMANDTAIQPPVPTMASGRYQAGEVFIGFEEYGFEEGWRIRYTINDGTEYDENGNLIAPRAWVLPRNTDGLAYEVTGDITPERSVVVKARRYSPTGAASREIVATYIIDEPTTLPVVSLTMDPRDLWDQKSGFYVIGSDPDQPNYREKWYRTMGFTYFPEWSEREEEGGPVSPEIIDTYRARLYGSSSKVAPTKSFALYADDTYSAEDRIPNLFFDGSAGGVDDLYSIVLRNSGGDNERTYMRDGLMSTIATGLDVDKQDVQPSVAYLNGQYWGLLNIREKVNEHFLKDHHPEIDEDSLDINEGTYRASSEANEGTRDEAMRLFDMSRLKTAGIPFIYDRFKDYVDIEAFIDYIIMQTFVNNTDWPWSNVKFWREHAEGSRWRFILYDLDAGFDTEEYWTRAIEDDSPDGRVDFAMVEYLLLGGPSDLVSSLFRALMRNEEFFNRFLERYEEELAIRFTSENLLQAVESFAALIEADVPRHSLRWTGSDALIGYDRYIDVEGWQEQVSVLRDFARQRPEFVRAELQRVREELHPDDPAIISNGAFTLGDEGWNLGWSTERTIQEIVERPDGGGLAGRVQILQGGEQFWQSTAFVHDDIPIPSGYSVTLSFDIRSSSAWRSGDELQVILFEPESGDEILQVVTRPTTGWQTIVKQVSYTGKEYLNTRLQFRVGKVSTGKDLYIDNVTIDVVKE